MIKRFVAGFGLALCAGLAVAQADPQPVPPPAPVVIPTLPPDGKLNPWTRTAIDAVMGTVRATEWKLANQSRGEVTYFKKFEMQVKLGADRYRAVHLHQGTVINPRGATLQPGQQVEVGGTAQADGSLNANVITVVGS
jgi:hypothetical protein